MLGHATPPSPARLADSRDSLVVELFSPPPLSLGVGPRFTQLSLIPVPSGLPRLGLGGVKWEFPLRAVGEGAAGRPSFRPSLDPAARGPPGARAPCQRMRPPVGAVPG